MIVYSYERWSYHYYIMMIVVDPGWREKPPSFKTPIHLVLLLLYDVDLAITVNDII